MKTIKRILLILILTAVGMVPVSAHMFSGNNWTWLYSDSEVSVYLGRYYYDVDRDQLSCYLGYRYPAQNSFRVEFTTFDYYYKNIQLHIQKNMMIGVMSQIPTTPMPDGKMWKRMMEHSWGCLCRKQRITHRGITSYCIMTREHIHINCTNKNGIELAGKTKNEAIDNGI